MRITTESAEALTAPGSARDRPPWDAGVDVRGDHRRRTPREHARLASISAPSGYASSLGWKIARAEPVSSSSEPVRGARERHERRHVHVVPARVHRPFSAAERRARALDDRQAVELGTRDDRRALRPDTASSPVPTTRSAGRRARRRRARPSRSRDARARARVQPVAQLASRRRSSSSSSASSRAVRSVDASVATAHLLLVEVRDERRARRA